MLKCRTFFVMFAVQVLGIFSAAAQPNVVEINSVATLNSTASLTSAESVHLASYYCSGVSPCKPDGGEGLLIWNGNNCDASNTDAGSTFYDASHNCWRRTNLNGDLRQWGITAGSKYDATANPTTVLGVTNIINTHVIPAMTAAGLHAIRTGQVSIKIDYDTVNDKTLVLPSGWSFTCGTSPVKDALNGDYTKLPGSLVIAHTAGSTNFFDASASDIEIHHCAVIIPEWYINPALASWPCPWPGGQTCGQSFASPAQSYADLEAIRANMISASDVAIKAGNGAYIHDLTILGFDNPLYFNNATAHVARNITMDAPIGYYQQGTNGVSTIKDMFVEPLLTKGVVDSGGNDVPNEQIFDVTHIDPGDDNGSGHPMCRLTLVAKGGSTLPTMGSATEPRGDPYYLPAWVSGPDLNSNSCSSAGTGAYGNDAAWALKYISPGVYDLIGSAYTDGSGNAIDTSADWSTTTGNTTILRISGPIANIAPGMSVTSKNSTDTRWPGCPSACAVLTVQSIVQRATGPDPDDGYNGEIVLSQPLGQPFSGDPIDIELYSATYTNNNHCQNNTPSGGIEGTGNCLFLNAAERYVAGYSDAGKASARLPASRGGHMAAGFLVDGIAGIRAINTVAYGHYYNIASIDSGTCTFYQLVGDDNGEINSANTVGLYATGGSRGCLFVGKAAGKPGAAIVNDTFAVSDNPDYAGVNVPDISPLAANKGYATATITTGGIGSWPDHGEAHICAGSGPCTPAVPPARPNDEIVAYSRIPGSSTDLKVIARGRFGSSVVTNWSGNATLFLSTVRDSTKDHPDKSATTIYSDLSTNTTTVADQFEVHHGAATFDNLHTSGGGIGFVSTNTAGVTVTAANLADASLIFEDDNAQRLTTVSPDSQFANYAPPGLANVPISILHPGGLPAVANNIASLGVNSVGNFNFSSGTTDNWPQNGVLVADNEEMAFVLDASNNMKLVVTARGLCGTTPAFHNNGIQVQFLVTELPCGAPPGTAPGLKGYASNGFTIGAPTGGDEGAGALNAQAIYRNGAKLGAANWAGGSTVTQGAPATGYYPCQGYVSSVSLPEAQAGSIASLAGTLRNLQVLLSAAPGSGEKITVTVRLNGSNTPLTCIVTGAATACADTVILHSAHIAVGQTCSVQAVSDSGAAPVVVRASVEFDN